VLTYRNTKDLKDFIKSARETVKDTYKIVVVNSYYDESSYKEFYSIAKENDCDFLNIENKGYGYGNNRGIEYAKKNYQFKFLIVSNPDIEIINFSIKELEGLEEYIIAPQIKTLKGKNQNPYYYSKIELIEWLKYYSCIKENPIYAYVGIIINKLYREIGLFIDRCLKIKKRRIYAAHGSFVIFGFSPLNKLGTVYDERMFLFSEENHLARLAHDKSIKTYMVPTIQVLHKEDGSVDFENEKMSTYARESFIIYYENWKKEKYKEK
jgi:GT2 family glycosyltransferase